MKDLESLADEILELPLEQRARLAERLLASLDDISEEEAQQLWAAEAARRVVAYETGQSEAHPGEAVHETVRQRLK